VPVYLFTRLSAYFPVPILCISVIYINANCYLWELYRDWLSPSLFTPLIPRFSLGLRSSMGVLSGSTIAFTIRSVDHSLSARLILRYSLSWSLLIQSLEGFSIALASLWDFYQDSLSPTLFIPSISHYSFGWSLAKWYAQKPSMGLTEHATASRIRVPVTVKLSIWERTFSTNTEIALEALPGMAWSRVRHSARLCANVR